MASGHVNRANRPNTWLLRPILRREDFPCQPGAVHTWPVADPHGDARGGSLLTPTGHLFDVAEPAFRNNLKRRELSQQP